MIETRRGPLSELIPALVAGYEAGGLFEHALRRSTRRRRASARPRPMASWLLRPPAAACCDSTPSARRRRFANAVSFTGGVLQSFADGTDEWRYQPGLIARNGLAAAELARAGSVAAPHALEGKAGLVRAFGRADCDVAALAGIARRATGSSIA